MLIRQEKVDEFPQIYDLVKLAFQTAKVSDGKEQDFVNQLRSNGNYIPELALLAEENGKLIGHIMLTRTYIFNGVNHFETLLLAPISVVVECRNKCVGASLIRESFRLAKEMGYGSVVLVGDPAYYHRFGFRPALTFGIKNINNIPDEYVMACELSPDALHEISGTIDFS